MSGRTPTPVPDPDAPREGPGLAYLPALDGVRALAVLAVMAYHSGIPWLSGGYFTLDTFFALSGFLITSLLLVEWERARTIRLGAFWARRARRLLPGLLLLLVFVVLYAAYVAPPGSYPGLRLDALSTLFYVANWHFILIGSDYFVQTGLPSLLTHTWSLAVEEQFYLVWPLVVLGVLRWTRSLRVLLVVCVVGALASAAEMAFLYRAGTGITRLYYGTDTHAQSLLVGAALAAILAVVARRRAAGAGAEGLPGPRDWAARGRWARGALVAAGVGGVAVSGVLWWRVAYSGALPWQGGVLLAATATAAVLASVACVEDSLLAKALAFRPLRYVGRISYGLYLWHYPLFQWLDGQRTGLTGYPLFFVRLAVTMAVATLSFYLVERPVRQRRLLRQWQAWLAAPVAVAGVAAVVVVATAGAGGVATSASPRAPRTVPSTTVEPTSGTTTIMMVGDSTALTLAVDLSTHQATFHVQTYDRANLGCGVAEMTEADTNGSVIKVPSACNPGAPVASQWPALWAASIAQIHPEEVALLAGRWEMSTVLWHGHWTNIEHPAFARYVEHQLRLAVRVGTSRGARMVLLTAPCFDSGEQPNGTPWPADSTRRLHRYNTLVRRAAADGRATVVNLGAMICPGGKFTTTIHGVTVRAPDGVHFPFYNTTASHTPDPDTVTTVKQFGAWISPRLLPELVAAATPEGTVDGSR